MSILKFKIDETEYVLPEYITIENYAKIYKIKDLFSDDYFAAKLINIICNVPTEKLLEYDYQEINYISNWLIKLIPTEKPKFEDRFTLDGIDYGFFPDWKKLSFAEFVDMDTISTKKTEDLLDNLHILAAIFYRPITSQKSQHDYEIEKYDVNIMTKRAELFKKKLDVRYVLGAQTFFTEFEKKFSGYSQLSSIPKMTIWMKLKVIWIMRKIIWKSLFNKSMDGSWSSTELLKTILLSMSTSIKRG